jgi:azurin
MAFRRDAKNNFVGMDELSSITLDAVKRFARNISIIFISAFPNTDLLKQSARLSLL